MFIAAFISRSITAPQSGQRYVRTLSGIFWRYPQQLHSWEDGYHLSTLISGFPRSRSLYESIAVNIPYPLSLVALPFPKSLFAIARRFRSSIHTPSYRLAISVDRFCKKSFLWFVMWRYNFAARLCVFRKRLDFGSPLREPFIFANCLCRRFRSFCAFR